MADAFVVSPLPDGSRPVSPETFSSVVHKLCAELDMPHVHLHSLRHFAATEMLSPGIDPRNAAEILGHANPTLTLSLFSHATLDRQRTAAEVLAARWCLQQRTHGAQDALRTISEDSHRASSGDPRSLRLTVELRRELRHVDVPATCDLEGGELPLAALAHHPEGTETEQGSDFLGRGELRQHLREVWIPGHHPPPSRAQSPFTDVERSNWPEAGSHSGKSK